MKKRFLSLLLACVMLFSLLCPAFAEDENAATDEIMTEESGGTDNDLPEDGGGDDPDAGEDRDDPAPQNDNPDAEDGGDEDEDISYDGKGIMSAAKSRGANGQSVSASGACGSQGNNLTWTLYDDGKLVIKGSGEMADYYTTPWDAYKDSISSVVLNSGVTSIGTAAFNNCAYLSSVTIPDSVISIGEAAFSGCTSLTDITIPTRVTNLGNCAFSRCSSLTSITIPSGVTSISVSLFSGCGSLSDITIPSGVTSIEAEAFRECFNLTSITIPSGITAIGNSAFSNCYRLTNIEIPSSVKTIGYGAFWNCSNLSSIVLPDGIKRIEQDTFRWCHGLTNITIPNGVINIGECAFEDCCLTSITIPGSVKAIAYAAFQGCESLTDVWYNGTQKQWNAISIAADNTPLKNATVHTVQVTASGNCGAEGNNLIWTLYDNGDLVIEGTGAMTDDGGFDGNTPWSMYNASIKTISLPSGLTHLGNGAFSNCSSLTQVDFPSSLTSIGSGVFFRCSSLTAISLPEGLIRIGGSAFGNCASITSVKLPSSLSDICEYSFDGCTALSSVAYGGTEADKAAKLADGSWKTVGNDALFNAIWTYSSMSNHVAMVSGNCGAQGDNLTWTLFDDGELVIKGSGEMADYYTTPWDAYKDSISSVVLNSGVTSIGTAAFNNCAYLSSVTIPDSVISIGEAAFSGCTSLTDITIPTRVTNLGNCAFSRCSSLTSITIPSGVTSISVSLFSGCGSLSDITIPSGVTSIEAEAFRECFNLTSITIPSGVTAIGNLAFWLCYRLTNIEIPSSVKTIGHGAFWGCSSLAGILLPDGIKRIEQDAFRGCLRLTNITIPDGVINIGEYAFEDCCRLSSITIPGSIKAIAYAAFQGCESLTDVWYNGTQKQWNAISIAGDNTPLKNATVHYLPAPVITQQPESVAAHVDDPVTFTVVATDAESYQWSYQKPGESSWTNVSAGGASASYTLAAAALRHNGYKYRCTVKNAAGSVTSSAVTLTVTEILRITTQPSDVRVKEGASASFKVVATGVKSYQWEYQKPGEEVWTAVSAASGKTASYSMTVKASHNGNKYRCKLTGGEGVLYTDEATLRLLPKPTITQQPESISAFSGEVAVFTVAAEDATGYQWSYQKPGTSTWTNVSTNGTSESYTLTTASRHNGYKYRCTVKNAAGSTVSAAAKLTVRVPIVITAHPSDTRVKEGAKANFKVVATGVKSYQWEYQKPGEEAWTAVSADSGKTASYSLTVKASHNGNKYRCKLTGADGILYTDEATLTLLPKPTILQQPESIHVYSGSTATFTVVVDEASSYQWSYQKPGTSTWTNVSTNGTSPVYSLTAETRHNGYKYRCTIKNAADSYVISAVATLTVTETLQIIEAPSDVRVKEGATATFKVVATGVTSYQWYYQKAGRDNWEPVSAASGKTACYSLTAKASHDGNRYRCILSGPAGSISTNTVLLMLIPKPTIVLPPYNTEAFVGEVATFSVVANGTNTYQWSYQKPGTSTWTNVSTNGTSSVYSLKAAERHDGYRYRCTVTNEAGSTVSSAATLTVRKDIAITAQPQSCTVSAGKSVSFKVTATGATSYQWQYQKPGETTWTAVSAASGKTASYSFTAAERHDGYQYRCLLKNAATSVYTDPVTLTVG